MHRTDTRTTRSVDGQTLLYAPDTAGPIAGLDSSGQVIARYVYATSSQVPDYLTRGGVTYRIVRDHVDSPRLIVNTQSGQIAGRQDYDEYGQTITDTASGLIAFGYAGGLKDADPGLVRMGARDYDPQTGRFTTKDPIGFAGGDTNLYSYVAADPINNTDPSGLDFNPVEVIDAVVPDRATNAAAGALNEITFGISNRIAGFNAECAGPGYGFGGVLGGINPKGIVKNGIKLGIRKAERRGAQGLRPPNLSPPKAGRRGAFNRPDLTSSVRAPGDHHADGQTLPPTEQPQTAFRAADAAATLSCAAGRRPRPSAA